jgi:NTP pyrophosphatase (non-canonical NTP hydrolase)
MEERLRANDHKGGWEHSSNRYLLSMLMAEVDELDTAILRLWSSDKGVERVQHEAADVANYAMMLFDNAARATEHPAERETGD